MAERVQLLSRQGCHLCDAARRAVRAVCEPDGVGWEEIDIDTDPTLQARYGELVPVVLVDNVQVGFWRISGDAIRAALR
ncbi:MAG TPA: glutaredoxin family protein [Actinotalea caeni]|uniref:glutaredoxin family protein n=1 Tax=Actinotalea caeni TaxID=1348467 RepID=UPI0012E1258F|nr:glutaredoxin family protein [Actinotalea caeni]HLV56724.1 glutaredoxin family protein [Actinotalea caeni]